MSQASASESTDELAKLVMPDAPQDLKKGSPIGLMKYLGPGLIMASASIGSGEIFFASRGGAVFGYVLLWTFVAAAILKGIAVYSGTRYITITGESPFARFGQVIPGPKNWFPVLLGILAVVSFPSWAGGFASFLGQWSVWTFGFGNPQIWASVWILLAFATLFFAGYSYVEKFQTGVVLLLIVFVFVAVIVANPNYFEVLRGLIPTIPAEHAPWVVEKYPEVAARPISLEVISYLGAIGGGTYDYIGYVGMYNEKKWGMLGAPNLEEINAKLIKLKAGERFPIDESEQNTENVRAWAKAPLTDTLISFVAVLIFSAAFMILGNVILGADGTQEIPNDRQIMQFQAQFFDQISPALVYFYQLAVWAAFFGSMQASGTMMYAHTFYQCFAPAVRWVRETNFFNVRLLVALIYSGGGLILVWTGLSFTTLVSFGALVGGVLSIGLWALAMLYTDSKFLPKKFQMATGTQILLGIAGVVLTGMGVVAILQFFNII
ncbi:MAG: Nramp family divalent metal transporter [Brooklawnia sp.]|nr:Nramp family divalent metal transporter [Brooklawnia sp.]